VDDRVVESCRRFEAPVRHDLVATLPRLAITSAQRLAKLAAAAWAAQNR
jgi:hypothetical protein